MILKTRPHILTNKIIDERVLEMKLPLKRIGSFANSKESIQWECNICKNIWLCKVYNIFNNRGCPECRKSKLHDKFLIYNNEHIDKILKEQCKNIIRKDEQTCDVKSKRIWECTDCKYNWKTNLDSILNKNSSCPQCKNVARLTNEFIDLKLIEIGNYITRIGNVINAKTKINWKCVKCENIFLANPDTILNKKSGCNFCNEPHGEKQIKIILDKLNLNFSIQKTLPGCKNKRHLRFDFCVYDKNDLILFLIEYQGKDHYQPSDNMIIRNPNRWSLELENTLLKNVKVIRDGNLDSILQYSII